MWNWFSKVFPKKEQIQRKRVQIDIPYEQHSYRKEDFAIDEQPSTLENGKSSN
ncbi:hypothetical protein [Shewanella violacea]|uniref:Uncharacterized protein n=1 Tax=Shewanella violacea (strain JCM 10179 / CIP 106290 / LMG 19151 / DSS12) TaxID=637905 RepID=D4ZIP4_SHEVD|nr:hypothetical protein [Shewanella violacea]BAJ01543.1 conserved hypothetical protein [Shewanella violacea DSS12]